MLINLNLNNTIYLNIFNVIKMINKVNNYFQYNNNKTFHIKNNLFNI